jgi:hypothetical protein
VAKAARRWCAVGGGLCFWGGFRVVLVLVLAVVVDDPGDRAPSCLAVVPHAPANNNNIEVATAAAARRPPFGPFILVDATWAGWTDG